MRHSLIYCVVVFLVALGLPSFAQQAAPSGAKSTEQYSSSSARASNDEVQQLRTEVASQNQTIQELKSLVQQLAQRLDSNEARVLPASGTQGAHMQLLTYDPLASLQETEKSAASASAGAQALMPEKKPKPPSNALEWTVGGTRVQLYGHADLSYDYVDNGLTPAIEATNGLLGTFPNIPGRANNGWLGQISSNLSYFGVRGSHKVNDYLTGIFQFETEVSYAATPGPTSDNQCKYCLGSRDSYVGVQGPWGAIKIGKEDAPYKRAIVPLDPFYNTIGDHRSIMGNSGGDNRAEFEGRLSHAIWYESPTKHGLAASILFSPGQNRSSDNGAYARAEPNCTGGNGIFVISFQNQANVAEAADLYSVAPADINPCNDGSWGNALSAAVTYKGHGLYGFGGYEHHGQVNRTTDLVGVADEAGWRFGLSYTFEKTGTTGSFVYEGLKRYATTTVSAVDGQPVKFPALDERTRPLATMTVISQKLSKKDVLSVDWIHAGKSPGDPGQCAVVTGTTCTGFADLSGVPGSPGSLVNDVNNSSNMYAAGLRHTLTRNMSTYFVFARQANHPDAHYDLGAVGHGVVVDKRDFTGKGFPGTRLQGISGGLTFDF
ncbi:MAG: porin [Terriglobales bacterium]